MGRGGNPSALQEDRMTAPADLETILSDALDRGGIKHERMSRRQFRLRNAGIVIEFSDDEEGIISLQGETAVRWLAAILAMNRA
jgi:hypothetical protein